MAKEGRVGLGLWDRLVLFVAWIVTCGLVYVLGFYVGKGTQERSLGSEERIVRLPVTSKPPPEGQRPKADSDFTFYDTLSSGERDTGTERPGASPPTTTPRAAQPATPPTTTARATPPATQAPGPRAGQVAPPSTTPRAAAAPPPAVAAVAPAVRPAVASPPAAPTAAPAAHPGATPPRDPPAPAAAAPGALGSAPAPPGSVPAGRGFTVQANPTRSRDEADTLYRQLRGRGYDASIVRVLRDGDTWYRVQVGRFASSEQATETAQRLREHEGVVHAFVASE